LDQTWIKLGSNLVLIGTKLGTKLDTKLDTKLGTKLGTTGELLCIEVPELRMIK